MVMFARSDQLEIKCEAVPGTSHVRPRRDPRDPDSEFVGIWGIDCKPCETGHLSRDSHWAKNRYRIPLTPDEEDEARHALEDAARMDAQLKLMEARERQREYREAAAAGQLDGLADPDDVAITTAADNRSPEGAVAVLTRPADVGASYRAMTVAELRTLARERGLPVTGSKTDLVARHTGYETS